MADYEELSPNFKNALMTKMSSESPFWALLGMELVDVKKGWAKVRLPFSEKLAQPRGIAHGGAIFSTADSAVVLALLGIVPRDETFTTVESNINFIRAFDQGEITAEARIINKGNKIAIGDVDVRNVQGDLIAKCLATFMILKKERYQKNAKA